MNTVIRFFIVDGEDSSDFDLREVSENEFLSFEGEIIYERHTMRENGVNQVCLTKGLPT